MTSIGAKRWYRDRLAGVTDRAIGITDPIETDNRAYDAEVFFGDQYEGLTSFTEATMPVTCDFSAGDACLDVKWTHRQNGGLIVTKYADKPKHYCTVYVLVIGWAPYKPLRTVGWAWGSEVEASWSEGKKHLIVPAHYLLQDELHTDTDDMMRDVFGAARRGS